VNIFIKIDIPRTNGNLNIDLGMSVFSFLSRKESISYLYHLFSLGTLGEF
jgi:hypothetical protein